MVGEQTQPKETASFLNGMGDKFKTSTLLSGDDADGVTTLESEKKDPEIEESEKPVEEKKVDEGEKVTDDSVNSEVEESEEEGLSEEDQTKFDEISTKIENEEELTEEEQQFYNDNRELSALEQFGSAFGVEDLSNYEDSINGILQMTNDVATVRAQQVLQEALAADPVASKFFDHYIVNGLPMETFLMETTPADFDKIDVSSVEGQKEMIAFRYKDQGLGKNEIDILIKNAETEGKLEDLAKSSKKHLQTGKAKQLEEQKALDEANRQKELQAQQQQAKEIQTVLSSGKILNTAITPKEAAQLKQFVTSRDNQGNYLADIAYSKATEEQKLFIDYLLMNDFKIGALVPNPTKTNKKRSLDNIVGGKRTKSPANVTKNSGQSKSNNGSLGSLSRIDLSKVTVSGKN